MINGASAFPWFLPRKKKLWVLLIQRWMNIDLSEMSVLHIIISSFWLSYTELISFTQSCLSRHVYSQLLISTCMTVSIVVCVLLYIFFQIPYQQQHIYPLHENKFCVLLGTNEVVSWLYFALCLILAVGALSYKKKSYNTLSQFLNATFHNKLFDCLSFREHFEQRNRMAEK